MLVSNCLLLAGNSGHPQALRRLLEWQHTKSPSPLQCGSCVYLPTCVSKMIMSKFTAGFRFHGREKKWVLAAREGRSRGSLLLSVQNDTAECGEIILSWADWLQSTSCKCGVNVYMEFYSSFIVQFKSSVTPLEPCTVWALCSCCKG